MCFVRSDIEASFESNPVFTGIDIVRMHLPIVQLNDCLTSSSIIQHDMVTHDFLQSTKNQSKGTGRIPASGLPLSAFAAPNALGIGIPQQSPNPVLC